MIEDKKNVTPTQQAVIKDVPKPPVMNQSQAQNQQQNQKQEMRYSGFWVRGAALIIDSLVLMIITMIVIIPISMILGLLGSILGPLEFIMQFLISIIGILIAWGYFIFMTYKFQATLGKMAVGAKVIGENGEKLSFGSVALRETIGKFISGFFLSIGYIIAAFTGKKQGLHDFMAKSVVIYKNPVKGPNTIVVVITYILYSMLMFIVVILFVSVFAILGLFIAEGVNDSGGFDIGELLWNNGLEEIIGEMPEDMMEFEIDEGMVEFDELENMLGEDGLQINMDDVQLEDTL